MSVDGDGDSAGFAHRIRACARFVIVSICFLVPFASDSSASGSLDTFLPVGTLDDVMVLLVTRLATQMH